MKGKAAIAACLSLVVLVSGCREGTGNPKFRLPGAKVEAEYDCRIHSADKICSVPWKDKTVLYCYKDQAHPRVVRYRWEC